MYIFYVIIYKLAAMKDKMSSNAWMHYEEFANRGLTLLKYG